MSNLTPQEALFYRDLYKVISDPVINELLVKYATLEYNKAIRSSRSKKELYDYGYSNGTADAWQDIMSLKQKLTKVMQNAV